MEVTQFRGRFLNDFARRGLSGFLRKHDRRQRSGLRFRVSIADLRDDRVRLQVAHGDEEDIVRGVFLVIITANVVRLEFIEDIRITDHGKAIRASGVCRFKQSAARAADGIVLAHVHFAADDIEFLRQLLRRQGCVLHDVAENVDGHAGAGVWDIDPIDGAVERGVGIHVAPGFLHFLIDARPRARGGAFEQHVFQDVRQAGAEPASLVNAAGHAPGLSCDDRRAVVLAHDDGQAVVERDGAGAGRTSGMPGGRLFRRTAKGSNNGSVHGTIKARTGMNCGRAGTQP